MKDFTANDARLIVKDKAKDDHVEFLVSKIKDACRQGQHKIVIRDEPYAQSIRANTLISDNPVIGAVNHLRASGFKVVQYCMEGQFCDWGLEISWEERS